MRFAFFPLHLSKVLRLPRKSDARSCEVLHLSRKTKCCTCHAKASQQTWRSDAPKCNQRPDLVTALMNMSLVLCLPLKMHLSRSSSNVTRLPSFLEMLQNPHGFTHFWQGAQSLPLATQNNASRPKSGASMWYFSHFDFEMCFTPQRRALFHHLNFQKWSEHGVLCTFWLGNVLPATTTCTFSSSQLLKMLRTWGVFTFFTGKCASRHNGVRFFDISTSKSGPDLVCFVHFDFEMCFAHLRATTACNFSSLIWPARSAPAALASLLFDPPEPQIIGKTCFATFLPFRAPGSSFFWDFFFFDLLSSFLFAASSHLCFSSVHIVGSLTSKLPSIIMCFVHITYD